MYVLANNYSGFKAFVKTESILNAFQRALCLELVVVEIYLK